MWGQECWRTNGGRGGKGGRARGCVFSAFIDVRLNLLLISLLQPGRGINMGDGWETARKPDRPAVLEVGVDGLVKVWMYITRVKGFYRVARRVGVPH